MDRLVALAGEGKLKDASADDMVFTEDDSEFEG
jgi:hypothetical protein